MAFSQRFCRVLNPMPLVSSLQISQRFVTSVTNLQPLVCQKLPVAPLFRHQCRPYVAADDGSECVDKASLEEMVISDSVQLFDVRRPKERVKFGIIPTATNIPLDEITQAFQLSPEKFRARYGVKKPDEEDANIVLHCLGGVRSRFALDALRELGFTKARHYPGGIEEWHGIDL